MSFDERLSWFCQRLPAAWVPPLFRRFLALPLKAGHPTRELVRRNLERILIYSGRDPSAAAIDRYMGEMLEHYARTYLFMLRFPEEQQFSRERVDLPILAPLEELRSTGRGVIVATIHFGLPLHAIMALGEKVPWRLALASREKRGSEFQQVEPHRRPHFARVGSCAREALDSLMANEAFITLTDFNMMPRSPRTLLFGAPAHMGYGAARLALASGSPILPAYAVVSDGRCRFEADAPIRPEPGERLTHLNERLARSIERNVRKHPGQWALFHDLWSPENPASLRFQYDDPLDAPGLTDEALPAQT